MTSLAERFYEPVKTGMSFDWDDETDDDCSELAIYAVRQRGVRGAPVLGLELRLSEEKADLLCDLLETVRRDALHRMDRAA